MNVASETKLSWIRFELSRIHGIEISESSLLSAIEQDAGYKSNVAREMTDTLAEDRDSLRRLADSLRSGDRPIIRVRVERQETGETATVLLVVACCLFWVGWLIGFYLRW